MMPLLRLVFVGAALAGPIEVSLLFAANAFAQEPAAPGVAEVDRIISMMVVLARMERAKPLTVRSSNLVVSAEALLLRYPCRRSHT